MLDKKVLEEQLSALPLFQYAFMKSEELLFTDRVRHIRREECPRYNTTWACPPAVGEVAECREKCLSYGDCLLIATITEVSDIANIEEALATRGDHEAITGEVAQMMRQQGVAPYILSTEACAICERCAYLDGQPCRFPERMHPCVESHGINIIPTFDAVGIPFIYGENMVTWVSLLFFT
jgi:predicted metal-binding protein